jgi:hypothetical protein
MVLRRLTLAFVVIGAGGFAAIHPDAVKAFYENIYPSDPAKRQALDMCFTEDHKFNRLDATERDACYKRTMFTLGEVSPAGAAQPSVNLVDLHRAAGEGSLPRNDILRLQEDQAAARFSR